jgi:hypothetical protein
MVDSRKFFGVTFVTLKDVAEGTRQSVIDAVEEGKFGKLNVTFEDGTALSLNATNCRILAKAYGAETDGWPGHVIELYAGEIAYQGKLQPAVRVRPISAPVQASVTPPATPKPNADMDDEIPF